VTSGSIDFNAVDYLRQEKANILGIYGQNGSGKTVVIEALSILKSILSGQQISNRYLESIAHGKRSSYIEAEFAVIGNDNTDCTVVYKCELQQRSNPNERKPIIAVTGESLKVAGLINGVKYPLQFVAQTNEMQSLVGPKYKCKLLFGDDESILKTLEQQKILALFGSRSFIFSDQAAEVAWNYCAHDFGLIINAIRFFAISKLFIVGGETQSDTPLPFNFVNEGETGGVCGQIPFSMESKALLPGEMLTVFESFVPPLNHVLSSMVPGLKIAYKSQKVSLNEKDDVYEIELFASRDEVNVFPLRHESLGIKKIISFLSLLIATYNNSSYVLAVDEFDSSVFEFLLGELISVIKESGKGQLIFTSHNLRPLEKLDAASICFTTTDPENRYIKLKKKTTNNLRDMYFRILSLGSDEFELYNSESKNALAFAFRQAGWKE